MKLITASQKSAGAQMVQAGALPFPHFGSCQMTQVPLGNPRHLED